MAAVRTLEAASSFDVFLSFRGKDTRKTFTDHLYTALVAANLRTFRDNEGIERGENIRLELERAVMHSRCSIIVLSEDYAASGWCLDELVMILERKKKQDSRYVVLPIFYHVNPSDLRKQKGRVKNAFDVHEERCRAEIGDERKKDMMKKVKGWREALREVADLAGMPLQNQADGHEAKFILKVVKEIEKKLKRKILRIPHYLVGIDSRIENINLWLRDGSPAVGIVALCGISGIGKTTIAKYVFNQNFKRFEGSSFLANIREVSGQPNGLIRLQSQLLSDILKGKRKKIWNVDEGIIRIKDAICCKRILLVLDDWDHMDQFEALLGMRDWLYSGSKIIITTSQARLLSHGFYEIHYVKKLDFDESFNLFSQHAFGQEDPADGYLKHSVKVVKHCGGLPLALKVLGSSLRGKGVDVWKSALEKLEAIPDIQIFKKLVICYDSLQDDHDKNLFLEIACFFCGKDKDYVVTILDGCDFHTIIGIQNLMDRCLLAIDSKNKLIMHQMVRDMGREIIRQESPDEPGKRTLLWKYKDSFDVLRENTGTVKVKGLALDMKMVKENNPTMPNQDGSMKRLGFGVFSWQSGNTDSTSVNEVYLKIDAFTRMHKLSLLQINYAQLIGSYKEFPKKLKWLCWRGFPMKSVPTDFPLESLVVIDMRNSSLAQFWKGKRYLGSLKILNLSHSRELINTLNFSSLPQLERLILKDCVSLVDVHESIGHLETKLVLLNLKDCRNLRSLPRNICMLKALQTLIISGCSNFDDFPREMTKMESLKVFHADRIEMIPSASTTAEDRSWHSFISTWVSRPRKCPKLFWDSLPHCLVCLSLSDCNLHSDSFPMDFSNLPLLKKLNLKGNPICTLPDCIRGLTGLEMLELCWCTRLQEITELPPTIRKLAVVECTSLEKITFQSNLLRAGRVFRMCGCQKLVEVEGHLKLETLGNIENEVIKSLGMYSYDLQSICNLEVKLYNNTTHTKRKGPIQGLFENGITSIFLPGDKFPGWFFGNRSEGSSVSVIVPSLSSNMKIQGLNVCTAYTTNATNEHWDWDSDLFTIISNETKNLKFIHVPTCYGLSEGDEGIIWLSHWKFHPAQLDGGDELNVSLFSSPGFEVKEVGVHFVYGEQEQAVTQSSSREIIQQAPQDYTPTKLAAHQGCAGIVYIGYFRMESDNLFKYFQNRVK